MIKRLESLGLLNFKLGKFVGKHTSFNASELPDWMNYRVNAYPVKRGYLMDQTAEVFAQRTSAL
jgi:hypothetical protein